MVKFDDVKYDDKAATEEKVFAPSFGVFDAEITEILPVGGKEFEMKVSKGNQSFYKARYVFTYSVEDKEKKISLFLNPGIWFPEEMKQLLVATKSDNAAGRTAIMKDTDALLGAKVKIAVGAKLKTWGDSEEFEGYEVGEYEGKKFIRNGIIGMGKDAKIDPKFEADLRERFKKGGGEKYADLVDETGFEEDGVATDEDTDF